jgi:hypothetical protein
MKARKISVYLKEKQAFFPQKKHGKTPTTKRMQTTKSRNPNHKNQTPQPQKTKTPTTKPPPHPN